MLQAGVATAATIGALILAWLQLAAFYRSLGVAGAARTAYAVILVVAAVAWLATLVPAAWAVRDAFRSRARLGVPDLPGARVAAQQSRHWCTYVLGLVLTSLIVTGVLWFITTDDGVVRRTFLRGDVMRDFWPSFRSGFWYNIRLALAAQAVVLVWALLVATLRMLPGRPGAPLRALVTGYTDVFRGMPAIATIYLFVFGMRLSGVVESLPILGGLERSTQLFWLCALAIVLVYGAYVSEVYRAGLESIHRSQVMAARSLGLSQVATLRHVVIPQAVRRVVPPLMNDFVALQKDTALIAFIGVQEALNRAQGRSSRTGNLTPMVMVGLAFLVITIPQTRLVDWLLARDARRKGSTA